MLRKARIGNASMTDDPHVNDVLRSIADLVINNICDKCKTFADYKNKKTINEDILFQALEYFKFPIYGELPEEGVWPACVSLRQADRTSGAAARVGRRGDRAQLEIEHENRDTRADCVYTENAPFMRVLKYAFEQRGSDIRITQQVSSWIQYICELMLLKILSSTQLLVEGVSKRKVIKSTDVALAFRMLKECYPLFEGKVASLGKPPKSKGGKGRGSSKGSAKGGRAPSKGRGKGRGGDRAPSEGRGKGSDVVRHKHTARKAMLAKGS